MSARRKTVLATLKQLNGRRMAELIRLRFIRRAKNESIVRHTTEMQVLSNVERDTARSAESLRTRLSYEFFKNRDLLEPSSVRDDEGDEWKSTP